jgi:pantetheine-phosphate adenylyltransferase
MKSALTRALYAGSFDPITLGHLDIIQTALTMFDVLHVAVGINPVKTGLFEAEERVRLIQDAVAGLSPFPLDKTDKSFAPPASSVARPPVEVGSFAGQSVIQYARSVGATHVVRGLRQASDFHDEFRYHGVFGRLDPTIPMVHFFCHEPFLHVSSSAARELAGLHEDLSWLVTPAVEAALRVKFKTAGS